MILDKYISKKTWASFLGVGLILVGIAWMIQILLLMKLIIRHGVEVQGFMIMSLYTFPMLIGMIMPFVAFIAVTSTYNRLIEHNEITVMAANGLSPIRIARPAIFFGIMVMLFHFFMSLVVIPKSQDMFYQQQWELRYGMGHLKLREATFNRMIENVVIYVEEIVDADLIGLIIRDGRDGEERIITSGHGRLVNTKNGMSIVMGTGGFQATGAVGTMIGTFTGAEMDMNMGDAGDGRWRNPRRLATNELLDSAVNLDRYYPRMKTRIASEVVSRFLGPVMNLLLVILAAAFLLKTSMLRRRRSFSAAYSSVTMLVLMTVFMSLAAGASSITVIFQAAAGTGILILALLWYLRK